MIKKGDIVLIPFSFTDLSGKKLRPAVVLFQHNNDITLSFITSKYKWKDDCDIEIISDSENGLKVDSILKLSKIATLEMSLLGGKLGKLNNEQISEINNNLIKFFKL